MILYPQLSGVLCFFESHDLHLLLLICEPLQRQLFLSLDQLLAMLDQLDLVLVVFFLSLDDTLDESIQDVLALLVERVYQA